MQERNINATQQAGDPSEYVTLRTLKKIPEGVTVSKGEGRKLMSFVVLKYGWAKWPGLFQVAKGKLT